MSNSLLMQELTRGFPIHIEHDPDFHQVVVDHFPHLRKTQKMLSTFTTTPLTGAIYCGDFHGLLKHEHIDERLHNILTEFNGFSKTTDYDGSVRIFYKIHPDYIEQLKKTYQARRKR